MAVATSRSFYVYLHRTVDGTPYYVGKGHGRRCRNTKDRSAGHRALLALHGLENMCVFPCPTEQAAFALEKALITELRRHGLALANKTGGGQGVCGLVHSEATKARLSEANRGGPGRLGSVPSAETRAKISANSKSGTPEVRAKISAAGLGRRHTAEAKAKIGAASVGNKHNVGRVHSAETRAKLSLGRLGNKCAAGNKNSLGRILSPESRARISAALKGKPWTPARRMAQLERANHG